MDEVEKSWPVWDVVFSPDGRWMAAGRGDYGNANFLTGGEGKVNVWDVKEWKLQSGFSAPFTYLARSIAFTPDGKCLVAAANQFIRVKRDPNGGKRDIQGQPMVGIPNPRDGNVIFVWTVSDGKLVQSIHLKKDNGYVNSLAVHADGELIALGRGKSILVLRRKTEKLAYEVDADYSMSVDFSPDGKTLASVTRYELKAQLYDAATGKHIVDFTQPGVQLSSEFVRFSPDGKQIAIGVSDGTVRLLAADLSKQLRSLEISAEKDKVQAFAYAAKADLLAAATTTRVRLFEASTGKQLREWGKADLRASTVALSPDGKLLAVGYCGKHNVPGLYLVGYVNIWDTATGRLVKKLD